MSSACISTVIILKAVDTQELPDQRIWTTTKKTSNRTSSRKRMGIEHIFRKLKVFRILSERYQNRRNLFALRFSLIATVYNMELTITYVWLMQEVYWKFILWTVFLSLSTEISAWNAAKYIGMSSFFGYVSSSDDYFYVLKVHALMTESGIHAEIFFLYRLLCGCECSL